MKNSPLVSIIIPSYNHAKYISKAIDSVLAQTYLNFEIIIVDDGSTDNSHEIILNYKENPKVHIILNKENKGQSSVLNQAIDISNGNYIEILPSDDWYLPEKTALQVAKFELCGQDVGVVYAAGKRFYEDTGKTKIINLPIHKGRIARKLIELGNFIYPVTPMYRRKVFNKVRFSEQFIAEGEAIHMRISLYFKYEYINDVVAVMRDHSYNIGKDAEKMNYEIEKHSEWYFSIPELPEDLRKLKKKYLLRNYRVKSMQLIFDLGMTKKGRKNIYKAFKLEPFYSKIQHKLILVFIASFFPKKLLIIFRKFWQRSTT